MGRTPEQKENTSVYGTVRRGDFQAMIEPRRYRRRGTDFDWIIARTNEHFWDPADPDYIDYTEPWDPAEPLMPLGFTVEMHSAVADRLDERQKIDFANESMKVSLSNILHGEQAALNLSASLCDLFEDPGAQEYAANQVREEARHVHAFTRYVDARFGGEIHPAGPAFGKLLSDLVHSEVVHEKIVGMQMVLEGLAMGTFMTFHAKSNDPLLRRLCQLVMTDEAFHHRFGKIWGDRTMPTLDAEEAARVEDWALEVFRFAFLRLIGPEEKRPVYERFGIDVEWAKGAIDEALGDRERRKMLARSTSVFRSVVKNLLQAGIITDRTRQEYTRWIDLDELRSEGDGSIGDAAAEEGIRFLRDVNEGKRKVVRKLTRKDAP